MRLSLTFAAVSLVALFSIFVAPATAAAQEPLVLDVTGESVDASALRRAVAGQLNASIVSPDHSAASEARGVLSILVGGRAGGHTAHVRYRPRAGQSHAVLIVLHAAEGTGADAMWIAEAAAAAVRTVDGWLQRPRHHEVLDPWLEGHRAQALTDPYDGERRSNHAGVQLDSVFVGQDIVNPWNAAVRQANGQS